MGTVDKITKKDFELILKITERATTKSLLMFDELSLLMDLECATKEFSLRLEDLLSADDSNFAHDIVGIQNNLNRATMKMDNFFVPRFSGK